MNGSSLGSVRLDRGRYELEVEDRFQGPESDGQRCAFPGRMWGAPGGSDARG